MSYDSNPYACSLENESGELSRVLEYDQTVSLEQASYLGNLSGGSLTSPSVISSITSVTGTTFQRSIKQKEYKNKKVLDILSSYLFGYSHDTTIGNSSDTLSQSTDPYNPSYEYYTH
mmetsp:Transcript_31963/g.63311  ORF Transcript_31963/g.63311 Transcript_31963/m.63311 type:complete len:117 (-) Transcript_31963:37-387(-)